MLRALARMSSSGSHRKVRRGSRPATSASHSGVRLALRSSCHLQAGGGGRAAAATHMPQAGRAVVPVSKHPPPQPPLLTWGPGRGRCGGTGGRTSCCCCQSKRPPGQSRLMRHRPATCHWAVGRLRVHSGAGLQETPATAPRLAPVAVSARPPAITHGGQHKVLPVLLQLQRLHSLLLSRRGKSFHCSPRGQAGRQADCRRPAWVGTALPPLVGIAEQPLPCLCCPRHVGHKHAAVGAAVCTNMAMPRQDEQQCERQRAAYSGSRRRRPPPPPGCWLHGTGRCRVAQLWRAYTRLVRAPAGRLGKLQRCRRLLRAWLRQPRQVATKGRGGRFKQPERGLVRSPSASPTVQVSGRLFRSSMHCSAALLPRHCCSAALVEVH